MESIEWNKAIYAARAYVGTGIVETKHNFLLRWDGQDDRLCIWGSIDAKRAQAMLKRAAYGKFGDILTPEQDTLVSVLESLARIDCAGPTWGCNGPNVEPEDTITCHVCQTIHEIREVLTGVNYVDPTLEMAAVGHVGIPR